MEIINHLRMHRAQILIDGMNIDIKGKILLSSLLLQSSVMCRSPKQTR
jgi:hypothetical protein